MTELLILRHAKSAWDTDAPTDFDRPLARRGERDRHRMADWLVGEGLCPDQVVSSAALRARTTAEAVVDACRLRPDQVEYSRRYYGLGPRTWLGRLREATVDRLLICGHNPGLDGLVELLSSTEPPYTVDGKLMTTAAIAHFRFDGAWADLAPGGAELQRLVRPKEL